MKEKEFITTIKQTLQSEYIGDDCAYLKDLEIVVTQDSLVEDVHFSMEYTNAYQLGFKSASVNISDICASGAKPMYLTVSLSLPKYITTQFIEDFYNGAKDACKNAKIVGGDITGAEKIYISVTAIGKTQGRKIASRSKAKVGQKIVVSGNHGSSGAGLLQLLAGKKDGQFVNAHLMPVAQIEFSKKIAENIQQDYAMMDTSDGLLDALSVIAEASGVLMSVDFGKIPYDKDLEKFSNMQDLIFFGGEDYELVATVPEENIQGVVIGEVKEGKGVEVIFKNARKLFTREDVEKKLYNHFEEKL